MAHQRKLRIIKPNEPDRFLEHNDSVIESLTEIINNTRQKMRVEVVETPDDGVTFKTIATVIQSEDFEQEQKRVNVIKNQQEEIAQLRAELEAARQVHVTQDVPEQYVVVKKSNRKVKEVEVADGNN
jgi:hypothetical protein